MLKPRTLSLWIAGTLALSCGAASAAPFTFNARQDAMGGAGVSTANYLSAPFYNPARLAMSAKDDQAGFMLPVIGVEVFDKDGPMTLMLPMMSSSPPMTLSAPIRAPKINSA